MGFDFKEKNVIVTGGAGGMGRCVVSGIVSGGGHAIIVDIAEEHARQVRREAGEDGVSVEIVDLSRPAAIRDAFAKLIGEFGHIDVLINIAGIVSTAPFEDVTQEDWDRTVNLNLTAVFAGIQSVFPHMKERRYGRIVTVSSVAGKIGGGLLGTSAYAASKAGVNGLTKAVAKEGGPYNICCNALCPSLTDTPLVSKMSEENRRRVLRMIPLHRAARPQEMANCILFLASDLASFVNGEISDCDGGLTLDG